MRAVNIGLISLVLGLSFAIAHADETAATTVTQPTTPAVQPTSTTPAPQAIETTPTPQPTSTTPVVQPTTTTSDTQPASATAITPPAMTVPQPTTATPAAQLTTTPAVQPTTATPQPAVNGMSTADPNTAISTEEQSAKSRAIAAIEAIYNYNYQNYQQKMTQAKQYFTEDGWQSFQKALTDSKNLETVKARQLSVSANITGMPELITQKEVDGAKVWVVGLPVEVKYQALDGKQITQVLHAIVAITLDKMTKQLGVKQLVIQPAEQPLKSTQTETPAATTAAPATNTGTQTEVQ